MTGTIGYFVAMHSTSRGDFDSYYAELYMPFVIAFTLTKFAYECLGTVTWFDFYKHLIWLKTYFISGSSLFSQ